MLRNPGFHHTAWELADGHACFKQKLVEILLKAPDFILQLFNEARMDLQLLWYLAFCHSAKIKGWKIQFFGISHEYAEVCKRIERVDCMALSWALHLPSERFAHGLQKSSQMRLHFCPELSNTFTQSWQNFCAV